ncbi:unnamed protein product [Ectocarpus sp. 12 AP-2014]
MPAATRRRCHVSFLIHETAIHRCAPPPTTTTTPLARPSDALSCATNKEYGAAAAAAADVLLPPLPGAAPINASVTKEAEEHVRLIFEPASSMSDRRRAPPITEA